MYMRDGINGKLSDAYARECWVRMGKIVRQQITKPAITQYSNGFDCPVWFMVLAVGNVTGFRMIAAQQVKKMGYCWVNGTLPTGKITTAVWSSA